MKFIFIFLICNLISCDLKHFIIPCEKSKPLPTTIEELLYLAFGIMVGSVITAAGFFIVRYFEYRRIK